MPFTAWGPNGQEVIYDPRKFHHIETWIDEELPVSTGRGGEFSPEHPVTAPLTSHQTGGGHGFDSSCAVSPPRSFSEVGE
jgi:hypothetical protein